MQNTCQFFTLHQTLVHSHRCKVRAFDLCNYRLKSHHVGAKYGLDQNFSALLFLSANRHVFLFPPLTSRSHIVTMRPVHTIPL
ncbi:hypothetical protein AHZ37_003048 [Salmonella enterica subsp. indica]|nr:hypothetical protein [Salmonella enterica subsp. arizonae]ECC3878579.1 hypothetical protein [Salmonella enterica subsp. indica]ECI8272652.1 hypothetical protein [Salmonella enterica subsp. enterica]EDR2771653.1 hypothetical protein [Salmonella enterica subsp. enterica serovar Oslo]ECF5888205.1 hypothetical protein [Salmonella enterica subsp. indica]